ncbi:hypothetical protein [Bosea sp. ANAM02]|uniref:hypothetical protein n=1 Tax=Bosea sp. ANAM02 TaxID=2020412 RepID=UPI00140EEAB5|nr:hypothetical protein [Bosea sp. ANAM02]BCB22446.1 hypothetical protein OCUBac02_53400 [Bosea sp. ANAM02]
MKVHVTIESPVTHVAARARFERTDLVVDPIEVEIAEISASDATPALFAEITPDGRQHEDRQAIDMFGKDPRLPVVSNSIELKGYGGALWVDAARDSRERYPDLAANRLRGKDAPELISYVSEDGASLPPGGLLHWLDEHAAHQLRRKELIVLSVDGPAAMPGNVLREPVNVREMIRDDRELNRATMEHYVRDNFLIIDGRLHTRTAPPGYWVAKELRDVAVGVERKAAPFPGRVWFPLTDTEAFEAFTSELQGRGHRNILAMAPVEIHHAEPELLALDQVHLGYAALRYGIAGCGSSFGNLPDDALLCWMELRREARRWSAVDGHAQPLYDLLERLGGLIPRDAKEANEVFGVHAHALMAQSKSLDLRERVAPEDDPELAGLQI